MANSGGVDRGHDPSVGPKLAFSILHGLPVGVGIWLAFGGFDWPDPLRARLLAALAALYFLRQVFTLFVLLQRRVQMSEVLGLVGFIALFEIGFLLLGAGAVSGVATPFGAVDWLGLALLLFGSFLNSWSEFQRWQWKQRPDAHGKCYTGGLFAYSMHINYFGDSVLFTGWAILAASAIAWPVPILITLGFVFLHIPALDAYLAQRYGDGFADYASRTPKFVPFVY